MVKIEQEIQETHMVFLQNHFGRLNRYLFVQTRVITVISTIPYVFSSLFLIPCIMKAQKNSIT
jgi:hypothetical protein